MLCGVHVSHKSVMFFIYLILESHQTINCDEHQHLTKLNEEFTQTEESKSNSKIASTFNPATLRETEWEAGILLAL